jgi:predicted nucleic acid-binding protein
MSEKVVCNSACLIALERISRLELLSLCFESVTIPPAVQEEFGSSTEWLGVQGAQNAAVVTSLKTQIGEGESEAIALAMELGDVLILLDDKKARRIAKQIGLKVMGTVGLLLRAKRKGVVTEIKPILDELQEAGFRISEALYQEALRLAREIIDGT